MNRTGYRQVADDLRAAILRGDYPPGSYIPTHDDLALRYGLNRNTIRRAIGLLSIEGLIDPIRGHGTVVRDRKPVRLPLVRYSRTTPNAGPWEAACAAQGIDGRTELVGVWDDHATEVVAVELGLAIGEAVVHRRHRMRAGDRVLQLQDVWFPSSIVVNTELMAGDKIEGGIYRALARLGHRPSTADETVTSRMPTPEESNSLSLRAGSPVLDIRRTTHDQHGLGVAHAHLVIVADHVNLLYHQAL